MDSRDNQRRLGAMYLRKSQADAEKERIGHYETLAKHRAELTAMARRMGLAVDRVFEELKSGESIAARDQFRELMDGVGQRRYEYVICHAVDRLGRGDMMEYGWVLSTFQYSRTLIITPGKTYDPTDPFDLQQLQLQMFFSNAEYMRIKERFKAGREASVRDGQYIGTRPPYGYDKHVRDDRKKTLKPNADAVVMQEIYRRIAAGETTGAVARDLNRRGIRTRFGNEWVQQVVKQKVSNPIYKGYVRWNVHMRVVEGRDNESMALKKRSVLCEEPIIEKGLHEPLVSEELWQQANDALSNSPKIASGKEMQSLFCGLLVCGKCGRAMVRTSTTNGKTMEDGTRKRYYYYKHRQGVTCKCVCHPVHMVVDAVVDRLTELAEEYEARFTSGDDGTSEHEEKLAYLMAERRDAERKRKRLVELYTAEKIGLEEFGDLRAPLDEQLAGLIEAIEREEAFTPRPTLDIAISIRKALQMLKDDSIEVSIRNGALRSIIRRIDYFDDGGGLELDIYIKEA